MQTKLDVLKSCTISGNIVKLPDVVLDRKLYLEVSKSLELIGGKWTRKVAGFVFPEDPTELLTELSNGKKRNLQKEFQYFPTAEWLADEMVEDANITDKFQKILEPSAGQGAIIKSILKAHPEVFVHYFELMDINRKFLEKIRHAISLGKDFLSKDRPYYFKFDRIIANPPFTKNQDIDHICEMYLCLKPGGRMVTLSSRHWKFAQEKKCQQFREWLDEVGAEVYDIEAGAFKESGTNIPTSKIIINKPL